MVALLDEGVVEMMVAKGEEGASLLALLEAAGIKKRKKKRNERGRGRGIYSKGSNDEV